MIQDGVSCPLALLPPNGAERRTGMALLVIRAAHFHLIARLLQSSHLFLVRLSLDARRDRARLESIGDEFKALVQECADRRVPLGDQCDIGLLPLSCHDTSCWTASRGGARSSISHHTLIAAPLVAMPCPVVPVLALSRCLTER